MEQYLTSDLVKLIAMLYEQQAWCSRMTVILNEYRSKVNTPYVYAYTNPIDSIGVNWCNVICYLGARHLNVGGSQTHREIYSFRLGTVTPELYVPKYYVWSSPQLTRNQHFNCHSDT